MATLRQLYFEFTKLENKYLRRVVIRELLKANNGIISDLDFYRRIDEECADENKLRKEIELAKNGYPYQYILSFSDFLGYRIKVNKNVLIPRQETEQLALSTKLMVQKYFPNINNLKMIDVCTGSGVLATYLKLNFPNADVYAGDIDDKCLEVAKSNAEQYKIDIDFRQGNLLEPFKNMKDVHIIIANPPYIEKEEEIDEQVYKYEPHLALIAKPATKFYEEIMIQAESIINKDALIAFEIGEDLAERVSELVEKYFPNSAYKIEKDIYGKDRFLFVIIKEDGNYA